MPFCDRPDVPVHYEVGGEGPPLLLLNGLVASAYLWPRAWQERFERRYRVIRVSNRGTGHTPLGEDLTVEGLADDALAVMDALGAARAHVLGFSMGGMVAQALTLARPDRVGGLVLCSTTTGGADDAHPDFLSALASSGGDAERAAGSFFHLLTGPGFFERNPDALAELAEAWVQAPTAPPTAIAQLAAAARFDTQARLAEITAPTLVLHGTDDRLIVPAGGRRLAAGIPGARLEIFEGTGHMLAYEQVGPAGDLVETFLAGVPLAPG